MQIGKWNLGVLCMPKTVSTLKSLPMQELLLWSGQSWCCRNHCAHGFHSSCLRSQTEWKRRDQPKPIFSDHFPCFSEIFLCQRECFSRSGWKRVCIVYILQRVKMLKEAWHIYATLASFFLRQKNHQNGLDCEVRPNGAGTSALVTKKASWADMIKPFDKIQLWSWMCKGQGPSGFNRNFRGPVELWTAGSLLANVFDFWRKRMRFGWQWVKCWRWQHQNAHLVPKCNQQVLSQWSFISMDVVAWKMRAISRVCRE